MKLMSPMDSMFLIGETREHPMHVGGLQVFTPPDGAGPEFIPGDQRSDAGVRGHPAGFPQASGQDARRIHQHGMGIRRRHRRRVSRAPLRPAHAGTGPGVAGNDLPAARHPARPTPAAVGSACDREPEKSGVLRRLHEGPPCVGRRRVRAQADAAVTEYRSRRNRDPGAVGAAAATPPACRGAPEGEVKAEPCKGILRRVWSVNAVVDSCWTARATVDPAVPVTAHHTERSDRRSAAVRGAVLVAGTHRDGQRRGRSGTPSTTLFWPCAPARCVPTSSISMPCPIRR